MLKKIIKIAITVLFSGVIFGCAQHSQLESTWGRSYESARYNQILNPEAEKDLMPVEGIDGNSAERVMINYHSGNTSKKQSEPNFGAGTVKK